MILLMDDETAALGRAATLGRVITINAARVDQEPRDDRRQIREDALYATDPRVYVILRAECLSAAAWQAFTHLASGGPVPNVTFIFVAPPELVPDTVRHYAEVV